MSPRRKREEAFIRATLTHLLLLAVFTLVFLGLLLASPNKAKAGTQTTTTTTQGKADILCPDAGIWGSKLIDGICWSCIFPIRVMGGTLFDENPLFHDVPDDAADKTVCACDGNDGLPKLGIPAGFWAPARMIEVVRKPYCSPTLGGVSLQASVRLWGGHKETSGTPDDKTFYNYHYFAFPLFEMLELLIQSHCNPGGYTNMDMLYLSELDPLWNLDELSFFVNPEAVVFANPAAMAMCSVDCAKTSVDKPMTSLFWCAGCWGNLYPFTGNIASDSSGPRDTSLLAARVIAGLHRRGLAWLTTGNSSLCGGKIFPMLPKQQYRLSTLFPIAEASTSRTKTMPVLDATGKQKTDDNGNPLAKEMPVNCCHYIGETPFKWGEWRTIPGTGEDYVYLLFRWSDCCLL